MGAKANTRGKSGLHEILGLKISKIPDVNIFNLKSKICPNNLFKRQWTLLVIVKDQSSHVEYPNICTQ